MGDKGLQPPVWGKWAPWRASGGGGGARAGRVCEMLRGMLWACGSVQCVRGHAAIICCVRIAQ